MPNVKGKLRASLDRQKRLNIRHFYYNAVLKDDPGEKVISMGELLQIFHSGAPRPLLRKWILLFLRQTQQS